MKVVKKQLLMNAMMSILQVFVISITLFILYRFLLDTIGVRQLGVWSLVLAATAVTQIANFGLSAGVVKFVAKYMALNNHSNVSEVIQTAAISTGAAVGCVLIFAYPIAIWLLKLIVPYESIADALAVLPFAMFSFWLLVIVGVFQSGLDGCHRIDVRSMLLMGSSISYLLFCFILAPRHGLMGVAYARVIQNASVCIISWLLLRKYLPTMPLFPCRWNKTLFKEMIGYGVNFQIISMTSMLGDPITKIFLTKFGGLAMVGYYEMASKMVNQLRALIVSANQVVVPTVSSLQEIVPEKVKSLYLKSYQTIFCVSLTSYAALMILIPLISKIWIGWYEPFFVFASVVLAAGTFLTTLAGPAYFTNLGSGDLKWNVIAHLLAVTSNVLMGLLLGVFIGGAGVVISMGIALAINSFIINTSYYMKHGIPLRELMAGKSLIISITVALIVAIFIKSILWGEKDIAFIAVLSMACFFVIVCIPLWMHPGRKGLTVLFSENIFKKS
ncbi:MAG: oligosaccharide flippase family protein [Candidatus Omnitrophica bacterium]|nr:oligosaccharide flippase family protein [Candidatus Omnitrophota bacterium]